MNQDIALLISPHLYLATPHDLSVEENMLQSLAFSTFNWEISMHGYGCLGIPTEAHTLVEKARKKEREKESVVTLSKL